MNRKIKYLMFTIIGIIIGSSACVIGSNVINANQVGYTSSKTTKTNIQDAIDELYEKAKTYSAIPNYVSSNLLVLYDGLHKPVNGKWLDLSGNDNNGIINGTTFVSQAVSFNGTSNYVSINEINPENITVEILFDVDSSTGDNQYIIANVETGGYAIFYQNSSKKIIGEIYIDGGYKKVSSTSSISFSKIYSATLTYDGSVEKLYVNGVYQSEIQNSSGITSPRSSTYLMLGVNPCGTNVDGGYFKGNIYSIRVYNKALSQTEITQNYNIDKIRFGI